MLSDVDVRASGYRTEPRILARRASTLALLGMIGAATLSSQPAAADESGVSFWLPGIFGSLAAVPLQPGWSFSTTNYYTSVSAGKNIDFQLGGRVVAGLNAHVDLEYSTVAYAFPTPGARRRGDPQHEQHLRQQRRVDFRNLDGTERQNDFGQPEPDDHRLRRPLSGRAAALEPGREQLHDLPDRRHSGRRLQFAKPRQYRHRTRRDRRRRRLYLLQPADRQRTLCRDRRSPTISSIRARMSRAASTATWTGGRRTSLRRTSRSARSVTSTSRSPATADRATKSVRSCRASWALGRK